MELNPEQIKAAALAATPGPWSVDEESLAGFGRLYVAKGQPGKLLGRILEVFENCLVSSRNQLKANAEFIAAANPAVVLELIERLERAERERNQMLEEAALTCEKQCGEEYSPVYNSAADDCARAIRALRGTA